MGQIPRAALWLGLAGLIPFVWGALTVLSEPLDTLSRSAFGPRFSGPYLQVFYGAVILSFMSGVLWGFATRATGRTAAIGYALSVIPAIWVFLFTGGGPTAASLNLIVGFAGLLVLDYLFWRQGLAPVWWMQLRLGLTAIVILCLSVWVYIDS
jgi:hypothetical protein